MPNLDQEIYNAAIAAGFLPTSAKLIVAQARFESADYNSNVFKNNNNLFGMKFIGQPLAVRGTLAPLNERSCNGNCNGDYYSKYNNAADSTKDLVGRLYKITRSGIGFNEIKNAIDALDFATKLKQRSYFGGTASAYANGLKAKLNKINIVDNNLGSTKNLLLIGVFVIGYILNLKK